MSLATRVVVLPASLLLPRPAPLALALTLASISGCAGSGSSASSGGACPANNPSAGLVARAGRALVCTTCGTDLPQGAHLGPIAVAADGNVLVAGAYGGDADFGDRHLTSSLENPYGRVAFLSKLDRNGKIVWFTSYPSNENSWIRGVVPLADGGAVAIGSTAGGTQAVLLRYTATGEIASTRCLPATPTSPPRSPSRPMVISW